MIIGIIIGLFGLIAFLLIKQTRDKKLCAQRLARAEASSRGTGSGNLLPHTGRIAYKLSYILVERVYTSQINTLVVKLFMISTGLQVATWVEYYVWGYILHHGHVVSSLYSGGISLWIRG